MEKYYRQLFEYSRQYTLFPNQSIVNYNIIMYTECLKNVNNFFFELFKCAFNDKIQ